MRKGFIKFRSIMIVASVSGSMFMVADCVAQPQDRSNPAQHDPLKKFLQEYLGKPNPASEREAATRYSSALVDLKGDGAKEAIVYVSGRDWCGSGGCTLFILSAEGASFRVVTKTTITRLPIRVLNSKSNGWHDISVIVGGGAIIGYEAQLCFDGKTYPENPTTPPARPITNAVPGIIVIPATAKDLHVYQ